LVSSPEGSSPARVKTLLDVFGGLIPAARAKALWRLTARYDAHDEDLAASAATQDELDWLVARKLIKPHKGKRPQRLPGGAQYVGYKRPGAGYNSPMAYPYDLAGARLTPEGSQLRDMLKETR